METLKSARLVLVGEQHTNGAHHAHRLRVVRFLYQGAVPVAIGPEIFRANQRTALDRWVASELDESEHLTSDDGDYIIRP